MASSGGFDECLDRSNECRFVIELGHLYFLLQAMPALALCLDVGTGVMEGEYFNLS